MCIVTFSLKFLTVKVLFAQRHLIMGATKLSQNIYFKISLILEFGSNDMLLGKEIL